MQTLSVRQDAPGTGSDWFGPAQPPAPLAQEVAGRTWDFEQGYNRAAQPRAYEEVGFAELRALADCYDPVRLIIERRKDQMCRLPWALRYRHDDKSKQLSGQQRSTLREIEDFLKHPCAEHSFRSWMRVLLEDLLVIDAPAIYCERDTGGNLTELVPIDGSTIKRILDENGRPPKPFHWNGEPFEWLGRTITAGADLEEIGAKIVDGMIYLPAYQQVLKGLPVANLTSWSLVYRPNNPRSHRAYGCSPVQQIITTVSIAMRRAMGQLTYFTDGNAPEGVFGLPETWTVDQVQQYQNWWDSLFVGNLGRRRQIKFMAGDGKFTPFKEPPLKSEVDEWLVRIVCAAFSYPPSAFVTLSNRSISESHERQAEEEGLGPLKQWACEVINSVLEREFGEDIEFTFQESEEVDPLRESAVLTRYTDSGIISRNEAREKIGLPPDPSPNASKLAVKTASGFVPIDQDPATDGATDDPNKEKKQ
jgi:hypothetical protein